MSNRKRTTRSPNKIKPIDDVRQLLSRRETARILGVHVDTIKKLEDRRGGPLTVVRLSPSSRSVFYRFAEVMALTGGGSSDPTT